MLDYVLSARLIAALASTLNGMRAEPRHVHQHDRVNACPYKPVEVVRVHIIFVMWGCAHDVSAPAGFLCWHQAGTHCHQRAGYRRVAHTPNPSSRCGRSGVSFNPRGTGGGDSAGQAPHRGRCTHGLDCPPTARHLNLLKLREPSARNPQHIIHTGKAVSSAMSASDVALHRCWPTAAEHRCQLTAHHRLHEKHRASLSGMSRMYRAQTAGVLP